MFTGYFSVWINLNITIVKVQDHSVSAVVVVIYVVVFSIYPSLRKTDRTSLRSRTSHAAESFSSEKRNLSSSSLPWSSSSSSPEHTDTHTHVLLFLHANMFVCVDRGVEQIKSTNNVFMFNCVISGINYDFTTWGSRVWSPIGRLGQVGWDLWIKQ